MPVFRSATRGEVPRGAGCRFLQFLPDPGTAEKICPRLGPRRGAGADSFPTDHHDRTVAGRTIIQCRGQRRTSPHNRCPCFLFPDSHGGRSERLSCIDFEWSQLNGEPAAGSAWPHCRQPSKEPDVFRQPHPMNEAAVVTSLLSAIGMRPSPAIAADVHPAEAL